MLPKRFPDRDEIAAVRASAEQLEAGAHDESKSFRLAGRVMARREMGQITFLDLVDRSGRMQLLAGKVDVDRTLSDDIAPRGCGSSVAMARQQGPHHLKGSPVLGDQLGRRLKRSHIRAVQRNSAVFPALNLRAETVEQFAEGVGVANFGDVLEDDIAIREQGRAHRGERRVLPTGDTHGAAQHSAPPHGVAGTTRSGSFHVVPPSIGRTGVVGERTDPRRVARRPRLRQTQRYAKRARSNGT